MASYNEHLNQVKNNIKFLSAINGHANNHIDWQVTTCFYIGVHLVNGFLARESNLHFNSHERVKVAIDPGSINNSTRLDQPTFLAYAKLRNLSRRSRYLCNSENPAEDIEVAHLIQEKHFIKAFKNLDQLMRFFNIKYMDNYAVTRIAYPFTLETPNLRYFTFENRRLEAPGQLV